MKSRNLLGLCSLLALFSACGNGAPKYDATGTFKTCLQLQLLQVELYGIYYADFFAGL